MNESTAVAMQEVRVAERAERLTASQIRADVNLIQEVMKAVMTDKVHYGTVPGCGDKPTLLKPGAEKIAATFRLAIEPIVEDLSLSDEIRYRVKARVVHQVSGNFLGSGIGEASTNEDKYKWRKAVSQAEWDATTEDRKRLKFARDYTVQQIRTNPSDVANTVLKMAKKRALIDAVLTITGASDIFTQDIEDMPEEIANDVAGTTATPVITPKAKEAPKATEPPPPSRVQRPAKERMKSMGAKFSSKCRACGGPIDAGDPMYYDSETKSAYHPACI